MRTLQTLLPNHCSGKGVSYTCMELCEHMRGAELDVRLWVPSSDRAARQAFTQNAVSGLRKSLVYRLPDPDTRLKHLVTTKFLRAMKPDDIAYLWPGVSHETYRRVKERGNLIATERINCHTAMSKLVHDDAYARLGWPAGTELTDDDVDEERRQLSLADFIFAPNPFVVQSLRETGVAEEKILPVSYGWSPERMSGFHRAVPQAEGLTVLFVGRLCVRKGIHMLLEAWERARIKGRLLLAGALHRDVQERLASSLARPDVIKLGYIPDIGAVYRSADVFAFGSLEEGGPMVTFEAMGCGLPVIVSPMGAGPARHGIDGFVIDPYDIDGWVASLRRMAADGELRATMGRAARERALEFTWKKVARLRRSRLLTALEQPARAGSAQLA